MVTVEEVMEALEAVHDPHVPLSLRSMGMIETVEIEAGPTVRIQLRMPCLNCPGVSLLHRRIEDAVSRLSGAPKVRIDVGWDRGWNVDLVEESARNAMREHGILL